MGKKIKQWRKTWRMRCDASMCRHHTACACVVKTWLAPSYRGGKSTLFFLIFPVLLANPEKWGQFSNPGNRPCLRAEESCWWRGKARWGETRDGDEKEKTHKKPAHIVWLHGSAEVGSSPFLMLKNSQSHDRAAIASFPLSVHTASLPLLRQTCCTSFTSRIREGCSNTTCFLRPPPWERLPTFTPLFFFSSSPRSASSLFIYSWMSVLLLIILQRIWVGFVSAVLDFL